jgi:hypothetical protein
MPPARMYDARHRRDGLLPLPPFAGEDGVGVPDKNSNADRSPHPPRSAERVDLPRKRER